MKKAYNKPELYVESFQLSQSIASACVAAGGNSFGSPNHASKDTCGWSLVSMVLWVDSSTGCNKFLDVDADFQGICYNTPNDGNTIFGS